MNADTSARRTRVVFGLCALAALVAVLVLGLEGPPGSGYGWGSVIFSMVLVTVPLMFVGLGVLSAEPRFAFVTIVVAALTALVGVLALIGNWSGSTTANHVLDTVLAVSLLSACLPAIRIESKLLHARPHAHGR